MKQQVFYIHGGSAYSQYEAFLAELEIKTIRDLPDATPVKRWDKTFRFDLGPTYEVFMPAMPNSQNARYQEWKIWFERHFTYLHDDIVLIGWSQGGMFLAKYVTEETLPFSVKALFLLAAPFEADNYNGEDCGDFVYDTSKVSQLQNKAQNIVIMHSTDDFVVPYDHALRYKAALPDAELMTFEDKNHFLVEEFPELLERVRRFGN